MKIWAHRGCSQRYPENTLLAFEKAAELKGLTGIELDIQLTKDGHLVVYHDERVDRTTDGIGNVWDFTLAELKKLKIYGGNYGYQLVPTIEDVFELLDDKLRTGLRINIELKNSVHPYEGMEEKIVALVHGWGLEHAIVYSAFYAASLKKIKLLDSGAELGILDSRVSDCMYKLKGGCGASALHPFWKSMDLQPEKLKGYTVRAWMTGHLYPEEATGTRLDIEKLEEQGITDIILNEPEMYVG